MRIVNSVLGDATGGRWQVVCDYSRVLSQQGYPVLMLLNKRHLPDLDRVPDGVSVVLVNTRGHYDYPASWAARRKFDLFESVFGIKRRTTGSYRTPRCPDIGECR